MPNSIPPPSKFMPRRGEDLLPWQYSKPGQLRQDYAVDEVLNTASVPGEAFLRQVRPQVPMIVDPPKYGYRREPLTIYDVLLTDRWAPTRRSWVSGAPALGNRRFDQQQPGAEGGLRNSVSMGDNSFLSGPG